MESSDCAAALEPGSDWDPRGASERKRYIAGASRRGEMALLISMIGAEGSGAPSAPDPLSPRDAWLTLLENTSVLGRCLPSGTTAGLAEGLTPADRDLGLRLRNSPPSAWWALELGSSRSLSRMPAPATGPVGTLDPILVDPLGIPVAAVWVPDRLNIRWYILPESVDWITVINWLVGQALPAYMPEALRRARSSVYIDPDLQTETEAKTRQALADLEERYVRERKHLEEELRNAQADAGAIRDGLLYGTGEELVKAVAQVFTAAKFDVQHLDHELAGTRSADLLVTKASEMWLIEVKSASGNAGESLVGDLQRHLATWPRIQPRRPVSNGALIVNHQHRKPPRERAERIYNRPEFAAALPFPVLSTWQLFDWWRTSNWHAIHDALLGH